MRPALCWITLLCTLIASQAWATSEAPIPVRCYYEGTYDVGILSGTSLRLTAENLPTLAIDQVLSLLHQAPLAENGPRYIGYSFIYTRDLSAADVADNSPLNRLLGEKRIALGVLYPSRGSLQSLKLAHGVNSFSTLKEKINESGLIVLYDIFGGQNPTEVELSKRLKGNILLAPQDSLSGESVCN